jgi:hypothetical protein
MGMEIRPRDMESSFSAHLLCEISACVVNALGFPTPSHCFLISLAIVANPVHHY